MRRTLRILRQPGSEIMLMARAMNPSTHMRLGGAPHPSNVNLLVLTLMVPLQKHVAHT
jgi:hypothetical protein